VSGEVSVSGVAETKKLLEKETIRYANAHKAALLEMAKMMLRASLGDVPSDTGKLRKSAFIRILVNRKGKISVRSGYSTPYAAAIHKGAAKRNGKLVTYRLHSGRTFFYRHAVEKYLPGYASTVANLTKEMYDREATPESVGNPYPYVPQKRSKKTPHAR
jgi:hypothetical protein